MSFSSLFPTGFGFHDLRLRCRPQTSTSLQSILRGAESVTTQVNETKAAIRRHKLFVDVKLQGALLAHTTMYWSYCLLSVGVIAIAWIVLAKKPATSADLFENLWQNFGPALIGAFLLLPLVLLDCLRLSNRFAGPMVRIQRSLKQLANGEKATKIKLREGDYWSEFAEDLNRVIDKTEAAADEPKRAPPTTPPAAPISTAAPLDAACLKASNIYSDSMV
jgi:hypothetical protein